MKRYLLVPFFVLIINFQVSAQNLQAAIFFDESSLIADVGTNLINDATANNGKSLVRPSNTYGGTVWYGPYQNIAAGDYMVSFRLKVASNTSRSYLFTIDVVNYAGGNICASLPVRPDMFAASNEWQLFTIPLKLTQTGSTSVEIRGIDFQAGITDLYFDYVQLIPTSIKGIYTPEFTIAGNGFVGIGTTTPNEKLSVNGKIRAKEIKVESTNWPDYVFKDGYDIGKLETLENYIKANKHLPEVPSAKEVETNGIELGDMVKQLLKNQEILTLHIIKQNKEIGLLNKKLNNTSSKKNKSKK